MSDAEKVDDWSSAQWGVRWLREYARIIRIKDAACAKAAEALEWAALRIEGYEHQAARQSAGANETALRVLSSHAIRKHEGVTIFGDPAQVLKVMAAIESAGATGQEPVGVIERDEVNGWHMNALVDWEKIGVGTKLYAAPIGDNGANEVCSGCDGEKGYLVDGLPYTCTQCDGKGTAPQPAESKRV